MIRLETEMHLMGYEGLNYYRLKGGRFTARRTSRRLKVMLLKAGGFIPPLPPSAG